MTVDELLELSDDDQKEYLNGQIAAGKTAEEVYADLQTCASDMARLGFFVVGGKFMIKPTRGYAKTKPTKLG